MPGKASVEEGSYSIHASSSNETAAKILIYERNVARDDWRPGSDGVYVLLRTPGNPGTLHQTVGMAPNYDGRFAFFQLMAGQNLDEMADFIAACADR